MDYRIPWLHCNIRGCRDCCDCRDTMVQVGKSYSGPREALRLNGKFVLAHLLEAAKLGGADLASSAFVLGLHQEVCNPPTST